MASKVLASKLITMVEGPVPGKVVKVAYATKTDAWTRPEGWLEEKAEVQFAKMVQKDVASLNEKTVKVVMRESMHPSSSDPREHITGLELDANDNVIGTRHFVP